VEHSIVWVACGWRYGSGAAGGGAAASLAFWLVSASGNIHCAASLKWLIWRVWRRQMIKSVGALWASEAACVASRIGKYGIRYACGSSHIIKVI